MSHDYDGYDLGFDCLCLLLGILLGCLGHYFLGGSYGG